MVVSEVVTLFFYIISIAFLPEYFGALPLLQSRLLRNPFLLADLSFVVTLGFAWKVVVIVAISALPLYIIKLIRSKVAPAASSKLL
jgi:phospholipid-translocating ATPase